MQCEMRHGDAPCGGGVSAQGRRKSVGNVAKKGEARPCVGSGEIVGEGKGCQGDGSERTCHGKKGCDPM